MFGMLSQAEVDRIFREGFVLVDDVRWSPQANNQNWLQTGAFLDSQRETSIRFNMAVSLLRPEKYTLVVLRGEQVLRRLDVRGSHGNPAMVGGQVWKRQTHKHRWTDIYADKEAYTPPDISADKAAFTRNEYETTFREFCTESNIDFKGQWQDPPQHAQGTLNI
jgi:hypothetical protein